VDPLLGITGQAYSYVADDPVNGSDPTGEISAGTICGEDGPNSAACKGAEVIQAQVTSEESADQGTPCAHIIDIGNGIVNVLDEVRHAIATHPVATAGLVLGSVALAIPGAEEAGGVLDESSIVALESGTDLAPSSLAQTAKTLSGGAAVAIDAYECSRGNYSACAGALLGGGSLLSPGDLIDELVGWTITTYEYATSG
jgi:hypothetical protein